MAGDSTKKQKLEPSKGVSKPLKIFSPFRALGNVSNEVPFAVGTLGSTFYIVTSVGRSFQIYDASTLHLLFVSQSQTQGKISALAAHFHYVYAASGTKVGIYKRGRLEMELEVPCSASASINHLLVFGEYLIAASSDGQINVFKKAAGSKIPSEHYTTINSIKPKFDGDIVGLTHPPTYLNKIVVATTNGIHLINVRTAKSIYKSPENQFGEPLSAIEFAPALDIIALGTGSGSVFLYNLKKGSILGERIIASPPETAAKVNAISFRTDGSHHLVAALSNGDLYFHDIVKRNRVHVLRNTHAEPTGGVANAKFLNGQPIVVTNGGDNQLKELVFDPPLSTTNSSVVSPPRHLRSRGGHSAPPVAIVFPNEDKSHFVYSASKDRSLWCFSMRKDAQAQEVSQRSPKDSKKKGGPVALMREKVPEITTLAMSVAREGDWENMVTAHKNEIFARTWDSKHKRIGRHELATVDGGFAKAVCVSHCGNFALVGSSNGGIGAYNLQSGLLRKKYMLHKNKAVTGLAIDGMNRKMVSCGLDGIIGFYNFSESKYLGKLELEAPITKMVYHKGSDLVACALDDLSIVVVDVVTQKVARVLFGHSNRITDLDFSPDGRWIVSVSLDGTLRTWDIPTGGCIDGIRLPNVATNVKFSPIGDFLATTHVSSNGISLWTNRAQFHPVSTRQMEEIEFSTALLPNVSGEGGASIIEGALDITEQDELDINQVYHSVDQINDDLLTLHVGDRNKYSNILHLDIIKKRNKPKEAPKKPEKAPFFLSLSGEAVGDQAIVAENGLTKSSNGSSTSTEDSRLRALKETGEHNFESQFTRLLREGSESNDYKEFIDFLVNSAPSLIDLELRTLNTFPPLREMTNFVISMNQAFELNSNYDVLQAIFGLFLKHHGDVIYAHPEEEELHEALERWGQLNQQKGDKLEELIKYCSGVINFVSTV